MTSGKLVSTSGSLVTLMLAREVGLTLKALLLPLGSPSRPCAVPLLRLGVGCGAVPGGQLSPVVCGRDDAEGGSLVPPTSLPHGASPAGPFLCRTEVCLFSLVTKH